MVKWFLLDKLFLQVHGAPAVPLSRVAAAAKMRPPGDAGEKSMLDCLRLFPFFRSSVWACCCARDVLPEDVAVTAVLSNGLSMFTLTGFVWLFMKLGMI